MYLQAIRMRLGYMLDICGWQRSIAIMVAFEVLVYFKAPLMATVQLDRGAVVLGRGDTLPAFIGLLHITYTQNPGTFLGVSYAHAMIFGYDVILYR